MVVICVAVRNDRGEGNMYRADGRLEPAEKKEVARFKDRYFKCEKCEKTIIVTDVEFAGKMVCKDCGGNLYEVNS